MSDAAREVTSVTGAGRGMDAATAGATARRGLAPADERAKVIARLVGPESRGLSGPRPSVRDSELGLRVGMGAME